MAALTEGQYTGEFILSEAPGTLSRDNVTVSVAAAGKLKAGHVLAMRSATSTYVEYDNTGTDGSEEAAAILYEEADNTDGVAEADFTRTIINLNAEVRKADLQWVSGASAGAKTAAYADLAAVGIKCRD